MASSYSSLMPSAARGILSSCRPVLRPSPIAPILPSLQQVRTAAQARKVKGGDKTSKRKKGPREFKQKDLKDMQQFALCDAMRYLRAFEVGREPTNSKYEVHVRLKTRRDGPVIRNMLRFPHSVQTESRICVVCPPGTRHEKEARAAGAVIVGEQEVFDAVKAGKIEFDRCLCHPDSLDALNKAGLGRILGPRGLMPSVKTGTVVEDIAVRVEMLRGGTIYRERDAVIRVPVGQLGFTPEQLRDNLRATIDQIKKDAAGLNDRITKEVYEVVLSSTNGPGFSLNGEFRSETSPESAALQGV
ncbi:mitochondrial 54S ribosomal protein uL1m [Aspergillus vadensis CBS 113365]|uniref:Mitochondrial large ribosomal subunit protein L1 n=1 Tax=Aspergillus vadensis (strain CBS 113365 / IMI 142717 / IBT 24658) TaxID=1448311 RepID=A0A319CLX4_ASPVC|nr:mitochondrial large ribosomal subunit protein L1 [Aspergillus vadensis CBS 113365]PYH69322.1 mitochondrial large ribosomal subunit protein L1 [Aspergillus vadensis CBS 113365]